MTGVEAKEEIYSDQIGRFLLMSIQDNAYVAVFYCYDGDHIKSILIRNYTKEESFEKNSKKNSRLLVNLYRMGISGKIQAA